MRPASAVDISSHSGANDSGANDSGATDSGAIDSAAFDGSAIDGSAIVYGDAQTELARVHAVLAAGVEQPRLLERWRDTPETLRALGVAPDTLDLAALGKFAGLSVKVRHNPLRALLPLSFRLMSVAALEIEVFSAYAAHRSRLGLDFAPTMPARARDLLEFLEHWYDPNDRVQALLWDAIRYEEALARLGPWWMPPAATAERAASRKPRPIPPPPADTPRLRGAMSLLELRSDRAALADALHASAPDLSRIEILPSDAAPLGVCVWRAPARHAQAAEVAEVAEVAVLRLDALGHALLGLIDGRRSVAQLARRLGGGRGATAAVRAAVAELAAFGIVDAGAIHRGGARVCA